MSIVEKPKSISLKIKQESFRLDFEKDFLSEVLLRTKQVTELNCRDSRLATLKTRSDKNLSGMTFLELIKINSIKWKDIPATAVIPVVAHYFTWE